MYQEITIIGNLGADPSMKYMPDGTAVTKLSVATNKKWTGSDGTKHEKTIWFRVDVWGPQAEACNQYLVKGRQVFVKGEMVGDDYGNPRTWTNNSGETRASFEIRAKTVQFLGGKGDNGSGAPADDDDTAPF